MPFVRDEDEIIRVVGTQSESLHMIFAFDLVDIDNEPGNFKYSLYPFNARDMKKIVNRLQRLMIERDGWNSIFCENHDQPRSVTRYCDDSDEWREMGAKLLSMMETTLSGTLYVYQGEELGMRNVPPSWGPEEYKDIESVNLFKKYVSVPLTNFQIFRIPSIIDYPDLALRVYRYKEMYPNDASKMAEARKVLQRKARDNARTPVQWDSSPHAGFTSPSATPWMRVNDDYKTVNAAAQLAPSKSPNELSVHAFWKKALANRKEHKSVLIYGDFQLVEETHELIFAYKRFNAKETWVVVLNFSGKTVRWEGLGELKVDKWVMGNYDESSLGDKAKSGALELRPWEGLLGICE